MDIMMVALGGAAGSVTRYALGQTVNKRAGKRFPWGTLVVNASGALLLGIVLGLRLPQSAALLLADGFLGAYTTFSTFMYEGFNLLRSHRANAVVYIVGSLVVGMVFFAGGFAAASVL